MIVFGLGFILGVVFIVILSWLGRKGFKKIQHEAEDIELLENYLKSIEVDG